MLIEANKYGWFWYPQWRQRRNNEIATVSGQEFSHETHSMSGGLRSVRSPKSYMHRSSEKRPSRTPLKAISDWAYTSKKTADPAGTSRRRGCFLDPLLSSGCVAMLAGYSRVCIRPSLTNSEMEDDAAAFYADNYQRMYEVTRDFLHYFYAGNEQGTSDAMFWKARKTLNLGENVGASQAFCFLVNTIPANPHPALKKQIHMYLQFMDKMDHPTEQLEAELGEKVEAMNTDQVLEDGSLSDDAVPQPNGALESSWQIDGETHTLRPIRHCLRPGATFQFDVGLAARAQHPRRRRRRGRPPRAHGRADHLGCPPCGTAEASGRSVDDLRAEVQPVLARLAADRLVLVRAEA